jgi:putative transposase
MEFVKVYEHENHAVGCAFWHIEFCTKYRYKMFGKYEYKSLCEACIRRVAIKHNIKIIALTVMPEHVHMIVQVSASLCIDEVIRKLKGGSAYIFFRKHPKSIPPTLSPRPLVVKRQVQSNCWLY